MVALFGCHEATYGPCASGLVCIDGRICDDVHGQCVLPAQLSSCLGQDDRTPCFVDSVAGTCDGEVCLFDQCGDGFVGLSEVCDHGGRPQDVDVTCAADCSSTLQCGNGVVDPSEECDCGVSGAVAPGCLTENSDVPGAACRSDCLAHCGDGEANLVEECDGVVPRGMSCLEIGFDHGTLECDVVCSFDSSRCEEIGWREEGWAAIRSTTPVWVAESGEVFTANSSQSGHYRMGQWTVEDLGFGNVLDVFGLADDDVWHVSAILGQGNAYHYDGVSWTLSAGGGITLPVAIWARAGEVYTLSRWGALNRLKDDVWAGCGDASPCTRPWATSSEKTFTDISGGATEVAVVGHGGILWHRVGETWTDHGGPGLPDLEAVTFSSEGVAFAVGGEGRIVGLAGGAWSEMVSATTETLRAVFGQADDDVVAVGDGGTVAHYDGVGWARIDLDSDLPLTGVGGANGAWVLGGDGRALFSRPRQWRMVSPAGGLWNSLWYGQDGVLWAVGQYVYTGLVGRYDGESYSAEGAFLIGTAVWGRGDGEVFVTARGPGKIWSWNDGSPVVEYESPTAVGSFGALKGWEDGLIAGQGDWVMRTVGGVWQTELLGQPVLSVWGFADDNVFVGADAGILRNTGGGWLESLATEAPVGALWASSPSDLYAGAGTELWHFDGAAWSRARVDIAGTIVDIDGLGADDVHVLISDRVHSFDGTRWTVTRLPHSFVPRDLVATPEGPAVLDGNGTIAVFKNMQWVEL